VIRRLRAIDHQHPELDEERAARAIAAHLRALDGGAAWRTPPIHWAADPREAERRLVDQAARAANADWYDRERAAYRSVHRAVTTAPDDVQRLWRAVNRAVIRASQAVAHLSVFGLTVTPGAAPPRLYYVWWGVRLAAQLRACLGGDEGVAARSLPIVEPLIDLLEAGVWAFAVAAEEVVGVPAPALRVRRGLLHCESGPAVRWRSGVGRWFWDGVEVPEVVVLRPSEMSVRTILDEPNVEARRIMLQRFGYERFVGEAGSEPVHRDEFGALHRIPVPSDEPIALVEVVNATAERDGSFRRYLLRVPPDMRTAREAVAWTFGMAESEYGPTVAS
jgi:hypothetical protein